MAIPKLCVILGAGASYDVHGKGSTLGTRQAAFRPPLAKNLFNIEDRPQYRELLEDYPGADHLAQTLAQLTSQKDFNLEQELRRLAEHPNSQTRENFKQIPAYLRDLLFRCSNLYTATPSSYSQLLQIIIAEHPHEVLFLTLNYDDLLEKAIKLFDPALEITDLTDYTDSNRYAKIVKFHGSIDWFIRLSRTGNWFEMLSDLDLGQLQKTAVRVPGIGRTRDESNRDSWLYPVLTAPLAGKGLIESVCPDEHVTAARHFLGEGCTKFLIIGTSGSDDDLMEFLDDTVPAGIPVFLDVVDPGGAIKVLNRFREGVRAFRDPHDDLPKRTHEVGFQQYVSEGGIRSFAQFSPGTG